MPIAAAQRVLQSLLLIGSFCVAAKLYRAGLWRRYPVFFVYFLLRVPNFTWPLLINTSSTAYLWAFVITEPGFAGVHVLLIAELYRLILDRYAGLKSMARWAVFAATAVSVFLSVLALLPHFTPAMPQQSKLLGYVFAFERGIDFSLVVFILLLLLFLSRFPIALSRNVLRHAAIFTVYFLSSTFALLLYAIWGIRLRAEINLIFTTTSLLCIAAWLSLLSPAGENVEVRLPVLGPGDEEQILRNLDVINATLLRISRKA